jgi:tRNA 2-selenouridine synthase
MEGSGTEESGAEPRGGTRIAALAPERALEWVLEPSREGRAAIDLRSEAEFTEDHLPGAVNVPLFDDFERALVGTLYRKSSPRAAFEAGRRLVRDKVASMVAEIARAARRRPVEDSDLARRVDEMTERGIEAMQEELELERVAGADDDTLLLYCWRGGLRSRSVAALLGELGLGRVAIVEGGYKSWRASVVAAIAAWTPPPAFVLRGLTGVGKTLVLGEIERLRPRWTVDLEALASHRSSILGGVGLAPVSQKAFETALVARIRAGFPGPLVVEGESRKVGDVILPPPAWRAIQGGVNVELVARPERRVEVLVDDYLEHPGSRGELREQLGFIEQRLGEREWDGELVKLLDGGRERVLAALLLERYYDPRYRHSDLGRRYAARFDSTDPARCAAEIVEWIEGGAGPRG